MKKSLLTLLLLLVGVWASARENPRSRPIPPSGLAFVENRGQVADVEGKPRPDVSFTADVNGVSLFFRPNAVSYVYSKVEVGRDDTPLLTGLYRMDMEFLGANPSPKISASDATEALNHFYLPHVPQGVTARNYRKVVYENLYPNVDLVFYGADESGALKYDFIVRPGGNVGDVRLRYNAADDLRLNADGSLSLTHAYGGVQEAAPYVFQESAAGRKTVTASYRLQDGVVTFNVGDYDKTQTLVIDPLSRSWSRYYGDSRLDRAYSSAYAADGSLYVVGLTQSTPFPVTTGAFQSTFGGANDAFITKFNTSGSVVWATLAGGGSVDNALAVAVNPVNQNIVVCGSTSSSNFPIFAASQPTYGGNGDGFIMKFTPTGSIVWSSYFGGALLDDIQDVGISPSGEIYLTGSTFSPGLATVGQLTIGGNRDAFIAKFNTSGAVQWFTYYGGAGEDIANAIDLGPMGNIAIGGTTTSSNLPVSGGPQLTLNGSRDAFVARFTNAAVPIWSTYLGGSGEEVVTGVTVFTNSNVVVAGWTNSSNFPTLNAFQSVYGGNRDGFAAKYNNATQSLLWSTYIGGADIDEGYDITIADNGGVHVVGSTRSTNFPVTAGAEHTVYAGNTDGFLITLLNNGVRDYATYIGGTATDIARGIAANADGSRVSVVGQTGSNSFSAPLSGSRIGSDDAFIITYNVNIVAPCQVSLQASQTTVCPGTPVTITATGPVGNNYSWTGPGGFSASGSLVTVTPNATGTYTVNVTGQGCLNSSATITIDVYNPTALVASVAPNNICGGDATTLSVTPTNLSNYVWAGPTGVIGTGTSVSVSPGATTVYTVNALDANGCNATATVTVTVTAPATTITPAEPAICIGQSVTLTASPADTYLWSTGETTQSISVSPEETTSYTVGTTTGQCSSTAVVTVTVGLPPVVTATPSSPAICLGQSITVTGSGAVSYQWLNVNTGMTYTGESITLTPGATEVYTLNVTGTDANGCQNTASTTFSVNPNPVFGINQGTSITVCAEQNFVLSASDASLTYQWSTSQSGQSITTALTSSQTISVVGTDANGCSSSQSISVNVIPVIQDITATALPQTVCAGQSVNLVASENPNVVLYEWVWNDGLNVQTGQVITVTPTVTTTYTLNAYNAQNCPKSIPVTVTVNPLPNIAISTPNPSICIGECATLTASGGIAYNWTWPGGGSAVGSTLQVCPTTTTSYTLVGIDANGCQNSAALTVAVNPLPTITISGPASICDDASGTLTASGAVSYVWQPNFGLSSTTGATVVANPPVTTTYTITGTDANGCVNSTTYTLVVNPTPTVSIAAGDNELCAGESTLIVASASLSVTYSWGHTTSNSNALTVAPTETTTYTVYATTAQGCSDTATITIVVNPLPAVTITAVPSTICVGESTTLTASGALTYVWSNDETTASVVVAPNAAGTYTYSVVGTDANGCVNSAAISVTVNPIPEVSVAASASEICLGGSVTFTASGNSTSYAWSTGDDTAEITVVPNASGTYTYTVTGTNEFGCTTSVPISVFVRPIPDVQVNKTDVTCYGGANGAIALSLTGGEPPHTIVWSGPNNYSSTVQNPSGLLAGVYTYVVTTVAGCEVTGSIEIFEPAPFGIEVELTQPTCNGFCDGVITVGVTDASEEPVIVLRDALTNNVIYAANGYTATFTGSPFCLPAGFYRVQVFVGSCSDDVVFELGQPDVLAATAAITNEVCFGDGLGSIDLTVTGGTQPYTFAWTGPDSYSAVTEDLSGLTTGGVYTVSIVDANGCDLTQEYTVIGPTESLAFASATVTDITCANAALGAIDITVVGGVSPYTYAWTGPNGYQNVSEDLLSIPAGVYTGTVTDAVGCQITATLEVRTLDTLYAAISVYNIRCYAENTGAINMTPIGGTPPYNISWTGPNGFTSSDANLSGLFAGTYELTLTDAVGCVWLAEVDVWQEAELLFDIQVSGNLCYGVYDGSIDLTVFGGGVTPYVYVWSGGTIDGIVTTEDVYNVGPGTYDLLIIDGNGCINFASVDFAEPDPFVLTIDAVTPVSCNGGSDGAIDATAFGTGLTFLLNGLPSTEDVSGLSAGNYFYCVINADGCVLCENIVITQPAPAEITAVVTDVACFGDATGAIDVTVAGGTTPYTYLWSNSEVTEDVSGLTAGTYSVNVVDANGCLYTFGPFTVGQPGAPLSIADVTVTDVLCNNEATGAIDITIAGGTPPYTYSWVTPSGNIVVSEDLFGIPAGAYTGTVTDANGCTISGTLTVNNVSPIVPQFEIVNVLCYGENTGAVTVTVNGGVGGYTYEWTLIGDPTVISTTNAITGVFAGEYNVRITDANGCAIDAAATVTQNPELIVTVENIVEIACFGENTGSIDISVSGGVPPYIYVWSGGTIDGVESTEDLYDIGAGTYDLAIIDGVSCFYFASVDLVAPALFALVSNGQDDVTCNGGSNGAIYATVVGGGNFEYYLNGNPVSGTNHTGLTAGSYNLTVVNTDDGCVKSLDYTITEPTAISAEFTVAGVSCFGAQDGAVTTVVTGGVLPYDISWTGPDGFTATTADIADLNPGLYTLTITHSGVCEYIFDVTVPGPTVELQFASESVSDVLCFGQAQGGIDIDVIGGTAPYSYAWTGPNGSVYATQDLYNLVAGTYDLTVTDANGCQISASYDVAQPTMLWAGFTVENVRCYGDNTASIELAVFGGTAPYNYDWTGPNGFTSASEDLSNLFAGTYDLTITDANGCIWMSQVVVTQPAEIQVAVEYEDACFGFNDGFISVSASGGVPPYIYFWETTATYATTLTDLAPGTYDLIVIDGNNCEQFVSVDIFELPQIVSSLVAMTQVTCPGGSDGALELSFAGGNDPYVLSVTGPGGYDETFTDVVEGTYTITGLADGTYTIVVVDSNACTETFTYDVTTIAPTQIAATVVDISCNGANDGAINLTITDGTPNYTYSWTGPGGYSNNIRDIASLVPGVYTVEVTDANGCVATASFTVAEPDVLALSFVVTDQLCANEDDGAINATVTGGTAPYTYAWSGPNGYSAATEDISGLATGFYVLTVTDNNGCTITSDSIEVVPADPVVINLGVIGIGGLAFCQGGSVTIGDLNATPGDSYQWQIDTTGTFTDIDGATSPTLLVTSEEVLFADQFRDYRLIITQGTCVFTSNPLTIQIFARPDITTEITTSANDDSPFDVCIGEVVTLSVPPAQPNTTYLWLINGIPSGSSHTITFTITDLTVRNVTVILQNTVNGCTNFNAVPYTFTPQSTPTPVAVDDDVILCAGGTATLAVTPEASTNYQWYLLNEGGDPLNINDYAPVGSGTTFDVSTVTGGVDYYIIRAERVPSECFAYSDPIRVTQSVLTIVSITQTPGNCFDNELTVVATTNLDPDANPISYTLSGGTLSTPVTNATGFFDGLGAGTYTLTVSDAAGCVITQTVQYQVFTPFISNIVALNASMVQLTIDYPNYGDPDRFFFVRYRVYPEFPSDGGPGQFVQDQVVVDDLNIVTIGGLQNNTRYEFYVWASCYDDPNYFNSPISNFVYVTTPQLVEACIRPGGLYVNVDPVNPTTAYVYWNWEAGAVYEVQYRLSGVVDGETIVYEQEFPGSGSCIGPFAAAPATITLTGLFPQSPYEIEVRKLCAGCTYDEFNPGDVSPWSSTIYFETGGACTVPTATVTVSGNMDGPMTSYCGDVALTANVTPADPGNYYYRWQYSSTGAPGTFVNVAQGYGENVLITNEFSFGTGFYRVIVRAGICAENLSTNTEELTIIAKPTVVVNVDEDPSTFLIENDHDNVAYITDCPGLNTGVVVVAAFGGTPPYQFSVTGPNGPWYNSGRFVNLPAGTYGGWVKDANGCVAEYDTSIPGQNPAIIYNAFSGPTVNALTDGSSATSIDVYLNLSQKVAPPYVTASNPVVSYRIAYRVTGTTNGGWTTLVVAAPADLDLNYVNDAPIVLTGLNPATSYDIRVRAICADNSQSAWSATYVATTGGIAATCEEVRNLVANVVYFDGDGNPVTDSVFVSWLAPDQPVAPVGYEVQWRQLTEGGVLVGNWFGVNDVTDLFYGINGLMEDTRYRVRVRSLCGGSNVSPWSVRDIRTPSLKQAAAGQSQTFTVYPNPNNGKFSVIFDSQEQGTVTLRLTDLVGRTIYTNSFEVNVGAVELPVEVSNYTSGVYTLEFVQGQAVTHVKLSLN